MVETYTTQWFTVTDGDSTTHNPQSLVATAAPIVVLDAEIRWEGIQTSEETTSTEYETDSVTATAEAYQSTEDYGNYSEAVVSDSDYSGGTASDTDTIPTTDSSHQFSHHETNVSYDGSTTTGTELKVTYQTLDGTTQSETVWANGSGQIYSDTYASTNYEGESRTLEVEVVDGDPDAFWSVTQEFYTEGEDTVLQDDTECRSYPSVPSGYTFDRHYYREEKNGSTVDSDYLYTDSVGNERCVTSNDEDVTWELLLRTRGQKDVTNTTYYDTRDPSVSGDVSGAYSGTLTDGEQSPWQSLSGLTADSETFTHQIGESGTAKFQFRFDWAYDAATPTHGTVGFLDEAAGVWRECAVAAPDDPALQYDHVGVYNDATSAWGVLDLVDASADGAISGYEVYDPDVGWLAPRQYSTTDV